MTPSVHIRRAWPLAALLAVLVAAAPAHAQSRLWRPDDRVLVTEMDELGAVATDGRLVFAASPAGLEIYDGAMDRWELPSTEEDGYPAGERPTALGMDRMGGELWLGTQSGRLYAFRPGFGSWEARGFVSGPVLQVRFARASLMDPVYVRVPEGWLTVERSGAFARPLAPGERPPEGADGGTLPDDPYFRAESGTLTMDRGGRRWPMTDVVAGERQGEYWVASEGGNLFHYGGFTRGARQLTWGLLERGAGSVHVAGDAVWFGGDGRGARRGVVRSDGALQRWDQWEHRLDGAPGGIVYALESAHGAVWAAAQDGLHIRAGEGRWRRLLEREGLPSADVRALLPTPGGMWVGTRSGLRFLDTAGGPAGPTLLAATPVHGLARRGDTLWVAAERGLGVIPLAADGAPTDGVLVAPGAADQPALRGRVLDVVAEAGRIYAVAENALYVLEDGRWTGPLREPSVGRLGRLALEDGQLWLAGEAGLGRLELATGLWTFHMAGADLPPGPVRDIAPAGEHVWVAGPYGALRLRWRR